MHDVGARRDAFATSPENFTPPSAMSETPARARPSRDLGDGGDLRHADARHDAGGADRARPDADLERVSPRP
jgi:hypothetical protein